MVMIHGNYASYYMVTYENTPIRLIVGVTVNNYDNAMISVFRYNMRAHARCDMIIDQDDD